MKLGHYIKTYFGNDRAAIEAFAKRCGTTFLYMRALAFYGKRASLHLAANIERESAGLVTAEELRPDLIEQCAYLRAAAQKTPKPVQSAKPGRAHKARKPDARDFTADEAAP